MAFTTPILPAPSYRCATAATPRRRPMQATLAYPAPSIARSAIATTASSSDVNLAPTVAAPVADPVRQVNSEADLLAALERSADQLVVLRVHARWCRSCRALEPKWRRLARELPQIHFAELEFEANRILAARLAVEVMPTFLIYDAHLGRVDKFSCGPKRAQILRERVQQAMDNRTARLAGDIPRQVQSDKS